MRVGKGAKVTTLRHWGPSWVYGTLFSKEYRKRGKVAKYLPEVWKAVGGKTGDQRDSRG